MIYNRMVLLKTSCSRNLFIQIVTTKQTHFELLLEEAIKIKKKKKFTTK